MARETIRSIDIKAGDLLFAIGGFARPAEHEPLKVESAELNTWSESVTLKFAGRNAALTLTLSKYWNVEVEREEEKAIYFFRNHSPVHEKLMPSSQLFKNASIVHFKGEIVKNTLSE